MFNEGEIKLSAFERNEGRKPLELIATLERETSLGLFLFQLV